MSLYLMEGFQLNLPQIFIVKVGIAEKIFKVKVVTRPVCL